MGVWMRYVFLVGFEVMPYVLTHLLSSQVLGVVLVCGYMSL